MNLNDTKGFTLIEVLIAITVFAIGILAVTLMQSNSTTSNGRAMVITDAATLAAERIEILQALPYTDPLLAPGPQTAATNPPNYTVAWTVTADTPFIGLKKIDITVTNTSGVISPTTSLSTTSCSMAMVQTLAKRQRWLTIAPLGRPVVPPVKVIAKESDSKRVTLGGVSG